MSDPIYITPEELRQGLRALPRAAIIGVVIHTVPRLNQKDQRGNRNPYLRYDSEGRVVGHRVTKRSRINASLDADYEGSVNRRRLKEGLQPSFTAEERAWGSHAEGEPLIEHGGGYYLNLLEQHRVHEEYLVDGLPVPTEEVEPFLGRKSAPERQGLEKPRRVLNPKLCNVVSITWGGNTYSVHGGGR